MKQETTQFFGKRGIGIGLGVALLLGVSAMQARAFHLGDFVWCDANRNGIQDVGETGVSSVTVKLFNCDTDQEIASTSTDAAGWYGFADPPSNFRYVKCYVRFYPPTGCGFSPQYQGGDPALDSNADPFTGKSECFTLPYEPNDPATGVGFIDYRFDAGLICSPPGTGTPGYWMNHPDAWPVSSIVIGGTTYTQVQAIAKMALPVKGNMVLAMFPALVSAKLNVLIGNASGCIADEIAAADEWMGLYGGSPVKASSQKWKAIETVYGLLDAYNNGLLCAPHRDSMNMEPELGSPATVLAPSTPLD